MVRLSPTAASPVSLTPEFYAAADPQISFDGTRVLFSAKRSSEAAWQVWEMNLDGTSKRQLTQCLADCFHPAYLPRGEIVYTAVTTETSEIYVSKEDGSDAHPITFGPGDFQVETILRNGTILLSARFPLSPRSNKEDSRELYTLRPDGSGLASFRCEHRQPAIRSQAEELEDGTVVLVKNLPANASGSGELVAIKRGALHNSPLTLPPPLAVSPRQLAPEELVVARRAGESENSASKLDLYSLDLTDGRFGAPIYVDSRLSSFAAVPVKAHEPPRWYWSTLNPSLKIGYFICLDSYLAEGVPRGRLAGVLAKVRVLTLDPITQKEITLGEAPVEKDGSFFVAIPPDLPVRFQLLDDMGRTVRAQQSWIWTRSGEEHGCVGCHEDRALSPENRWPLALRRFDTPTRLGVEVAAQPAH